jgi:hypothetical protein
VAETLRPAAVLEYNSHIVDLDCVVSRSPKHARDVVGEVVGPLGCHLPEGTRSRIVSLLKTIECPTRLSTIGVTAGRQQEMIAVEGNAERPHGNPWRMGFERVDQPLESIR